MRIDLSDKTALVTASTGGIRYDADLGEAAGAEALLAAQLALSRGLALHVDGGVIDDIV